MCKNNVLFADTGTLLNLRKSCTNVGVVITDSSFETNNTYFGIHLQTCSYTNSSILVSNSIFRGVHIYSRCPGLLKTLDDNDHCSSQYCRKFVGITMLNSRMTFWAFYDHPTNESSILIEDSIFSHSVNERLIEFNYARLQETELLKATLSNVTFANNNNNAGSLNYLYKAAISYNNCIFENNIGTAIQALYSNVTLQGSITFKNNSGVIGGGIHLDSTSYMHLQPNASISFVDNHADYVGGAIYIDHKEDDGCFFQVERSVSETVKVTFVNNTANYSGSSMYGNGIKLCCDDSQCSNFFDIFNVSNTEADPSAISSDPDIVCICQDMKRQPNCSPRTYNTAVFPGQVFPIRLTVVGTVFDGVTPGAVRAYFSSGKDILGSSQTFQENDKFHCEDLKYSVNSTEESETFALTIEQSFSSNITGNDRLLTVTVELKDCPEGFFLSPSSRTCVCDRSIENNVQCNITDQSFLLPANSWLGFGIVSCIDEDSVVFNPHCPVGYCSPNDITISSDRSHDQCRPHRTGRLCGRCENGYSLALGTLECVKCSHYYLFLVVPMAMAGLLLVAVILALNLTVTEGCINGLLFYANVIGLDPRVLFMVQGSYLYPFLAWINLDFGIKTCFYDGMDRYEEAWLQFAFPVYLWLIILVLIQLQRRFPAYASRLGGEKTVKVLATVFLLSFTKLIRAVATILSFTTFKCSNGVKVVWLYDANLDYFKKDHIILGIAGVLVLVLIIAPYILCLTFFQQLQACSGHRVLRWVNSLKPVFDSYAGPYKDKYRFWTGMLLVVRTLLFILFNVCWLMKINLMIILVVSFILAVINSNGIYKKWLYSYLESFFFFQLGAFAASAAYLIQLDDTPSRDESIRLLADISIALSLIVFLAIIGYQGFLRIKEYYHRKGYNEIVHDDLDLVERK